MWNGTVTLQDGSAVYVGQSGQNTAHALVAVQLASGLVATLGEHAAMSGAESGAITSHVVET